MNIYVYSKHLNSESLRLVADQEQITSEIGGKRRAYTTTSPTPSANGFYKCPDAHAVNAEDARGVSQPCDDGATICMIPFIRIRRIRVRNAQYPLSFVLLLSLVDGDLRHNDGGLHLIETQ